MKLPRRQFKAIKPIRENEEKSDDSDNLDDFGEPEAIDKDWMIRSLQNYKDRRKKWLDNNLDRDRDSENYVVPYTSFSNYHGGFLEKSNCKEFKEKFPWLTGHWDWHQSEISLDEETAYRVDAEEWESFTETVESLESYPALDDRTTSEMEFEAQWEAWEQDYRDDTKKEFIKKASFVLEKFVYVQSRPEVWDELLRHSDVEWREEEGCSMYMDIDRLWEKSDFIRDFLPGNYWQDRFDHEINVIWDTGIGNVLEKLLRNHFANNPEVMHHLVVYSGDDFYAVLKFLCPRDADLDESPWIVDEDADPDQPCLSIDLNHLETLVSELNPNVLSRKAWRPEPANQLRFDLYAKEAKKVQEAKKYVESLLNA